ncbi:hypothetical protein [Streptomyces sp. ML-6]|uniref:hypothetical protein n=1 Tax=Streptomyces sp. ML-6 TaxID=2982693 RepID=UPI0024C09B3C|nr:hypothetical protein [Streptomyces sp. ML-6]MDK0524941.1 hypothetical protein [Streptomyces sp. ML-6]
MTTPHLQTAPPRHPGPAPATTPAESPGPLDDTALTRYFADLATAVEQADPGPAAPGGWEERERVRVCAWVRTAYEHPLSTTVFAHPDSTVAHQVRTAQATELGFRIDVGRSRTLPAKPSAEVRAVAAVAAMWAVTATALTPATPRPPRERLVADAWTVVRETIAPALVPEIPTYSWTRGTW